MRNMPGKIGQLFTVDICYRSDSKFYARNGVLHLNVNANSGDGLWGTLGMVHTLGGWGVCGWGVVLDLPSLSPSLKVLQGATYYFSVL